MTDGFYQDRQVLMALKRPNFDGNGESEAFTAVVAGALRLVVSAHTRLHEDESSTSAGVILVSPSLL